MENRLVTSVDLAAFGEPLPEDIQVLGFKLVKVGPETMALAQRMGAKICEIVDQQPGFFIIGSSSDDMRQSMHDLVDRFCNKLEGK